MNEQTQTPANDAQPGATQASAPQPAPAQPAQRTISDPREVAAVVMGHMRQVRSKKDELGAAIDALMDITQQLTRGYGAQQIAMEQLRRRVKALEDAAGAAPGNAPGTVQ